MTNLRLWALKNKISKRNNWVADIFWKGHFLERSFFGKGHYLDPKKYLSKKCTFPKNVPFQKIAISKKWPFLKKFIIASKS